MSPIVATTDHVFTLLALPRPENKKGDILGHESTQDDTWDKARMLISNTGVVARGKSGLLA